MARKGTDAAKAKAAREKKLLIVLSGVFVLALGYAAFTLHLVGGKGAAAAPPAAAATTAPAAGTSTPPPLAGIAPAPAPASAPPAGAAGTPLVAAVTPPVGSGQLESFSRFDSKDPFDASGPKPAGASSSGSSPAPAPSASPAASGAAGAAPGTTTPAATTPTVTAPATPPAPPPTSAVIAVNGVAASVSTDADFPVSTDPTQNGIFQLVGLTETTAEVTVVGGSYASGVPTLTLKVNQAVTLVNTADGKRYTLELFPQGTVAPPAASGSAASGTTP